MLATYIGYISVRSQLNLSLFFPVAFIMTLHTSRQYAHCYKANCKSKNPLLSWYPKPYPSGQHCSSDTPQQRLAKGWEHEGDYVPGVLSTAALAEDSFSSMLGDGQTQGCQRTLTKGLQLRATPQIWKLKSEGVTHFSRLYKQMAGYLAPEGKPAMETSDGSSRS